MNTTSPTLLDRVKRGEAEAWRRFVQLYVPLFFYWANRIGLQDADASDLVQDLLARLVTVLPRFEYGGERKNFRGYLRTMIANLHRQGRRKASVQREIDAGSWAEPPVAVEEDSLSEREYRQFLVARAMQIMEREFEPTTWKACWECVVNGRAAREVAAELQLSEAAVYQNKSRVLRRLRDELQDVLDD